jgi:hypothetical protein
MTVERRADIELQLDKYPYIKKVQNKFSRFTNTLHLEWGTIIINFLE